MVMGEGGEMTQVTQPTQVVAIDNGDGTQQFAIPVIDEATGQESYMIIDPETAQSMMNNGAEAGQQMMLVDDSDQMVTDHDHAPVEAGNQENMMVMLPNGEQGMVVTPEEYEALMQQQAQQENSETELVQDENGKQMIAISTQSLDTMSNGDQPPAIVTGVNGFTPMQKPRYSDSSNIKIVGIKDHRPSPISLSKPLQTKTSYSTFQPDKQQIRAPRKQSLGSVGVIDKDGNEVPKGLTGDLFMDTELVEKKVQDICKKITMTEKEKEKLRLNLMTKGLNTGSTGLGRGRRVPQTGRGRPPLAKIPKTVSNKTIKCDMCKKEFPHNVDESVLINHVKTVHMNKKSDENLICNKCDRKMPTATALKYHTCTERYQCPDCNKMFMQKSTLIEHQAVAHRPKQPSPPPQPKPIEPAPISLKIEDGPPIPTPVSAPESMDEFEPPQMIVDQKPADLKLNIPTIESVKKDVLKTLVDDWDEDDDKGEKSKISENASKEDKIKVEDNINVPESETEKSKSSRQSVDKTDDLDEDQIVADVDDILNDTDNIMSDVDTMLSNKGRVSVGNCKKVSSPVNDEGVIKSLVDKKRPTEQCEECYECFEDKEKLAWHNLNDH